MNEPQLSAEEVIKKDFPELAEAMAAHCITTTVPDEPNGQPLELWVMPIGQVVSWMRIANKHFLATALEEQYKKALSDMFLAIAKLAEPDERQPSAGNLTTNMDNIWEIKVRLEKAILNGKDADAK